MTTSSTTTLYVTRKELDQSFSEFSKTFKSLSQHVQELKSSVADSLGKDVQNVKSHFESLSQDMQDLKPRIASLSQDIQDVKSRFSRLEQLLRDQEQLLKERLEASEQGNTETLQIKANTLNSQLRHPFQTIRPIVAYKPGKGIIHPEMFPKNAIEFYSLKNPKTKRKRDMLHYLIHHFDLPSIPRIPFDYDSLDSESNASREEEVNKGAESAVYMLEGIIGLREDNFAKALRLIEDFDKRQPATPVKRTLDETEPEEGRRGPLAGSALAMRPAAAVSHRTEIQLSSPPSNQGHVS